VLAGRETEVAALLSALAAPGLVVLAGPPGIGKSALAGHALGDRPVVRTGGLATLRHVPGLPLTRALRTPVPPEDVSLAVEAVRVRLGDRVLLVDDLHWADPYTLAVLVALAAHVPVVGTVRLPCGLAPAALAALRAGTWIELGPLGADAAAEVAAAAGAGDAVDAVVARAGGNPLALSTLARSGGVVVGDDALAYGVAAMVAELPRPARTALAALGLLGRPAAPELLGPGAQWLLSQGLTVAGSLGVVAREPYVAEVAAGALPADERLAMHARLASLLTDAGEAARHRAAAGDLDGAASLALAAAAAAPTAGARADQLLYAARLREPGPQLRLAAARAALDVGRVADARLLLDPVPVVGSPPPGAPTVGSPVPGAARPGSPVVGGAAGLSGVDGAAGLSGVDGVAGLSGVDGAAGRVERAVLLARALTAGGEPAGEVLRAVAADLPGLPAALRAEHAVASVRAELAEDPDVACALAEYAMAELGISVAGATGAAGGVHGDGPPSPAGRGGAGPGAVEPGGAGPGPAGPGPAGPDPAEPGPAGPGGAGAWAGRLGGTGPGPAGPDPAGPGAVGPGAVVPGAVVPGAVGPGGAGAWAGRLGGAGARAGGSGAAGVLVAYGEALAAAEREGWEAALRAGGAAARAVGDLGGEVAAGAALVDGLRDSGRTAAAATVAAALAQRCAEQGAYSPEMSFRADLLWARLALDGVTDELVREAGALLDRAAPAAARARLRATLGLAHADGGAMPAAWAALRGGEGAGAAGRALRWVAAETAWLDGLAEQAGAESAALAGPGDEAATLAALTLAWSHADASTVDGPETAVSGPAAGTLAAWAAGDAAAFRAAAAGWAGARVRERVRCLLAAGTLGDLPALLEAEELAESAGLGVLLGRVRRALRGHGVVRRPAATGAGGLSPREREVLGLVGRGLSTRRIAEQLGITRHTAETYVKTGMTKLGARTRTEAAVRAGQLDDAVVQA
jgi:DNA-binding CsgD family transcriptional regulator